MGKNGVIATIFIFLFVSTTCNASLVFHLRRLIASEENNSSATSQVSPIASPVNDSNTDTNTSSINTETPQLDKQKESAAGNQTNSTVPLPVDPKGSNKNANDTQSVGVPAGEKNDSGVDGGNDKANVTVLKPDDNVSCDGSHSICMKEGMIACVKASKDGSKDMFIVVKNEGEVTLKVNVKIPNSLQNILADEVPKHSSKKINISSSIGKSNKIIVSSGGATCKLDVPQPVSVDKIIQQLSYYSKQVTPIYGLYASFLVTLLLGGIWGCCRLRKRNQKDEIAYQELEMGIPESASTGNVDGSEGWDENWDEDWDEDIAVKSPSGHQVRSVSADGLTSRSPKRDGWENGWED